MPRAGLAGWCPACLLAAGTDTQPVDPGRPSQFEPPSLEHLAQLFPQLEILQLLGAGGMGAVYKARQPNLDRVVALKILPAGKSERVSFPERFTREARALARLNHPNIVVVHEFGDRDGLHYFLMEYVDGANLRQLQQAERLAPREALQIIPQICDALQYAHDQGVVHRDIKPENILIDRMGRVRIADFGLAKILGIDGENLRLTGEGQVMGTPHYMAPEQIERPLAVDHRADIYSLGVVFYEMLTGELPLGNFSAPSNRVSVDVRLDEVVLRALQNDPARRYQHASEVKTELKVIAETPPGAATPAPGSKTTREAFVRWAGIPLVVDRDGDREVTWDGGLTALGIGFVLCVFGLQIFAWVTGKPMPAVVGFPFLITIGILGMGFRWALNAPLPTAEDEESGRAAWTWLKTSLALGSVLLATFSWGVLKTYGIPALRGVIHSPAAQVAPKTYGPGFASVNLPERGRVDLLAAGYGNAGSNQWWAPNGTLVTNAMYRLENAVEVVQPGMTNRDLIVRLADLPQDASGPIFEFEPPADYGSGGTVLDSNGPVKGAIGVRVATDPSIRKFNLRLGLGLAPWRTIASQDPRKQFSSAGVNQPGDPRWTASFNSFNDTIDGCVATVVIGPETRDWMWRIAAFGTNGVEHSHNIGYGPPGKDSLPRPGHRALRSTWTYKFQQVSLSSLREFRLQVRPVHWVEFKDIPLHPIPALPPPLLHGAPPLPSPNL